MYFSQQYIMCIHRLIAPQPFQGERQIFADEVERHETRKGSHYYTRACEGAPSYSSERACPSHVRAIHEPAKVLRRIVVRGLAPVMPEMVSAVPFPTAQSYSSDRACPCHARLPLSCSCKNLTDTHHSKFPFPWSIVNIA